MDMAEHQPSETCQCKPIAMVQGGSIVWLHKPLEDAESLDLVAQAEAVNAATGIELWAAAELARLKIQVIPFATLAPIQLPRSKERFSV